jgi:hypothetical protein
MQMPQSGVQRGQLRRGLLQHRSRLRCSGQDSHLPLIELGQLLGTMLESAVHDGLTATNPVHGAERPKVEVAPVVPFTNFYRPDLGLRPLSGCGGRCA